MALYTQSATCTSRSRQQQAHGRVRRGRWQNYVQRLRRELLRACTEDDVRPSCAATCAWGMSLEESLLDFRFIHRPPGAQEHPAQGQPRLLVERPRGEDAAVFRTRTGLHSIADTPQQLPDLRRLRPSAARAAGSMSWITDGTHNGKVLAARGRAAGDVPAGRRGTAEKLCFLHYPPLYQGYDCPEILRLLQRVQVWGSAITAICTARRRSGRWRECITTRIFILWRAII